MLLSNPLVLFVLIEKCSVYVCVRVLSSLLLNKYSSNHNSIVFKANIRAESIQ